MATMTARARRTATGAAAVKRTGGRAASGTKTSGTKAGGTKTAGGISDAAVKKATGKGWEHWFGVLDRFDVKKNGHASAAEHVHEEHACPPWWSQMVVVQYEQARGLRARHQKADGFSVSAGRVINVPVGTAYRAWQGNGPRGWLPGYAENGPFTVRKATANKSMRITWCDGKTSVEVNFYGKGKTKCQVTAQHNKLASAGAGGKMKKYWGTALDSLRAKLEG